MEKELKDASIIKKTEKKLKQTTKRIIKRRKDALEKEIAAFQEINSLLLKSDEVEPVPSTQPLTPPAAEVNEIPDLAPDCSVLNSASAFSLFTEDSLELKSFLPPNGKFLGVPVQSKNETFFRNFISSRTFELRVADVEVAEGIRLYVFHLLAVCQSTTLASSSFDFLLRFPCSLTTKDILPLFVNFGVSPEYIDDHLQIAEYLVPKGERRKDFPLHNIEKVAKFLTYLINRDWHVDASTKHLVVLLVRLSQDLHVRRSLLLPAICGLLSTLLQKVELKLGSDVAASWLHLPIIPVLNQLDICRLILRPVTPQLHHILILRIVNSILKTKLKVNTPFQVKDLKVLLWHCNKKNKALSLLDLFVIFELLTSSLPDITAKPETIRSIFDELTALERVFIGQRDSSDLAKLRAAAAKFHSLVMMRSGSRLPSASSLLLTPSRSFES